MNMKVEVQKLTDINLLQEFAGFTTGKECKMSLATAYRNMHSIIRTQLFVVKMTDIPQFVASQLVRQTQGVTWCMRSKRADRGGRNFKRECEQIAEGLWEAFESRDVIEISGRLADVAEYLPRNFDRNAPTDLIGLMNAEALMNMAHKRLCTKASLETIAVVGAIRDQVRKADPDLADHMVPQCIYRGGICPESKPCGICNEINSLTKFKTLYK